MKLPENREERLAIMARFMGMKKGKEDDIRWSNDWFEELIPEGHAFNAGLRHTHLQFDNDWNWIIPVIQKIQDIVEDPQDLDHLKDSLWMETIEGVFITSLHVIVDIKNGDIKTIEDE